MLHKTVLISVISAFLLVGSAYAGKKADNNRNGAVTTQTSSSVSTNVSSTATSTSSVSSVDVDDAIGLMFMVEEEKLARDVYEYLYQVWGVRVFSNIAKAEQTHLNAVLSLINTYSLEVPSTLDSRGIYEDESLQALYDTLIAKGEQSLQDALEVGVLIEQTDIDDLKDLLATDLPSDVRFVYERLLKGSYNHLSAFSKFLSQ